MIIPTLSSPTGPTSYAWWAFDAHELASLKSERGMRVSLCLPARDEEETIGGIVAPIRRRLVDELGLIDDLVVIDDGSCDRTAHVAKAAGARVVRSGDVMGEAGPGHGKGDVIWKSLAACDGDVICWVDADIRKFDLHFVTGLLGPLLRYPEIHFVKGHYRRPLHGEPTGGGRVTELLARPLLSRFFPEVAGFAQPLAGEYAGTRALLETIPIVQGWGVEVGLLIDVVAAVGIRAVAQVDLGVREHRNRPLHELAPQAMAILLTTLRRAGIDPDGPDAWELLRFDGESGIVGQVVGIAERPPMVTMASYRKAGSTCGRTPSGGADVRPNGTGGPVAPPPLSPAARTRQHQLPTPEPEVRPTMAKLEPGDTAPAFTLSDADGSAVSLEQFAGRRVVLYFYPKDDTPGCTKEACQFNDEMPEFTEEGAVVIGVSPDSSASHVKFRNKYGLGFTLLSDPSKTTMQAYGAYGEKMMYGKTVTGVIRSTFIIGEDGNIVRAWYSVKADGHATKVLAALKG